MNSPSRGLIDIHCHILPGLDDGPSTLNEALDMLRIARLDGVGAIVATPHIDTIYGNSKKTIEDAVMKLGEMSENPKLYAGADIRIKRGLMEGLFNGELPPLNGKNHFLLELPHYSVPPLGVLEAIVEGLASKGMTTIVTHPERNPVMAGNPKTMKRLFEAGAVFQLTAMSLTGGFGAAVKKAAWEMAKKGHVHFVASDAHDSKRRPPVLSGAYEAVRENLGEKEAKRLFIENPLRAIRGERAV